MRTRSVVFGVLLVFVFVVAACGQVHSGRPARPGTAAPTRPQPTTPRASAPSSSAPTAPQPTPPTASTPATRTPLRLTTLHMLSASNGWAVLRVGQQPPQGRALVARTIDGGRQWVDVSPWGTGAGPVGGFQVDFTDTEEAWLAVAPPTPPAGTPGVTVYHTVDGGQQWTRTAATVRTGFPNSDPAVPVALSFADATDGWLMVQPTHGMSSEPGQLLATTDGGHIWTQVASTYGPRDRPGNLPFGGRIRFMNATTGWLAGGLASTISDLLYVTHDAGRTWEAVHLPVPPGRTQQQMVVAPPTVSGAEGVLPVWFQGRAATYLYVTSDGGASWRYTQPVQSAMPEVLAIHEVLAVNGETVYRTTNGGQTWTTTQAGGDLPVLLARRGAGIQGVDFADARNGWIFGTEPARPITAKSQWATTPILPFLVRTRDGGRTWSRLSPTLLPTPAPADGATS